MFGGERNGVAQDLQRSLELAQRGASSKPPIGMCLAVLGRFYLDGKGSVCQDTVRGEAMLQEAINMGVPSAMQALAYYYDEVLHDKGRAIPLYLRAAELGHVSAMTNLAFYYKNDANPPQLDRAIQLYQQAAGLGEPTAMVNLAEYYMYTVKPPQIERARKLLQQAARLGQENAIQALTKQPFVSTL
jgi:TPR repeat protein